jgi:hypothetical protein
LPTSAAESAAKRDVGFRSAGRVAGLRQHALYLVEHLVAAACFTVTSFMTSVGARSTSSCRTSAATRCCVGARSSTVKALASAKLQGRRVLVRTQHFVVNGATNASQLCAFEPTSRVAMGSSL